MNITRKSLSTAFAVPALAISLAACGGGEEGQGGEVAEESAEGGGAETEPAASELPKATMGKTPGTLVGTVAGHEVSLEGTCSASEMMFEFWSDGKEFATSNDSDGDGNVLNIAVVSMNDKTVGSMRFHKDDEKIYNGTVPFSTSGDATMTVNGTLGWAQAISADLKVNCG